MSASRKVTAARTDLLLTQPFWGALALGLIPKEDPACDTAWTDGRHLGYNPAFIESLSHAELVGLIAHEVMHCLAPETEVITKSGLRPIASIEPGDKVWGRGGFTTCLANGSHDYDGEIIRLRGAFGPSIRITPNHGVLCLRTKPGTLKPSYGVRKSLRVAGNIRPTDVSFIPAGDLDPSRDLLAFAIPSPYRGSGRKLKVGRTRKNYTQHKIFFDTDMAYLTGLFLADGNLSKPCNGKDGGWFKRETSKLHRQPSVYPVKGAKAKRIIVSAKTFANFLQRNFYDGKSKAIPAWMIGQSDSVIRSFIEGLTDGDGHATKNRMAFTTIFPQIAGMLPLLLMRIGIFPSMEAAKVRRNRYPNGKPVYRLTWQPDSSQVIRLGNYWLVRITEHQRESYTGKVYNISTTQQRYSVPFFTVHNCALGHIFRRDGREPEKWNMAADYALNGDLQDCGFTLPKNGLFPDATQKGKSAEWIYARLPDQPKGKGKPAAGEVRDAPSGKDADGNPPPTEGEWKQRVAEALTQAKMQGSIPGELQRKIEGALDTRVDVKALLLRFFTERCKADYSWHRPNPRFLAMSLYLPVLESTTMGEIAILVDTSGSTSSVALQFARGVLEQVLDEVKPAGITLYFVDTKIHGTHRMEPGDTLTWEPKGGGGTCFASFFEAMENPENPPVCIVGISDLYANFGDIVPAVPVLWLTDTVNKQAPFGETIFIDR